MRFAPLQRLPTRGSGITTRLASPCHLRPQVFSTSRRLDPPRACRPCFMPDPLMGLHPSELCSSHTAVRHLRRRCPLVVGHSLVIPSARKGLSTPRRARQTPSAAELLSPRRSALPSTQHLRAKGSIRRKGPLLKRRHSSLRHPKAPPSTAARRRLEAPKCPAPRETAAKPPPPPEEDDKPPHLRANASRTSKRHRRTHAASPPRPKPRLARVAERAADRNRPRRPRTPLLPEPRKAQRAATPVAELVAPKRAAPPTVHRAASPAKAADTAPRATHNVLQAGRSALLPSATHALLVRRQGHRYVAPARPQCHDSIARIGS
jgi:hypothetical protein